MNRSRLSVGVGRFLGRTGVAAAVAACGLVGVPMGAPALGIAAVGAKEPPKGETLDTIIFKDGRVVKGTVISQNDTTVTVKGDVNGIAFQAEYSRADILSVKLAEKPAADPKATPKPVKADTKAAAKPTAKPDPKGASETDPAAAKVYVIELTGRFGRDISQTPIRQAVEDARKSNADVIVVSIDNDWSFFKSEKDMGDDVSAFDEIFRAEDMDQIFTDEITHWPKPPRIAFWVKKAMGGAAFLAMSCPEIYFQSEARMGGVGWVNQMMANIGDDVVQRKQVSLRLAHAEGIAARAGYPTQLVRAMAITEYVLSYAKEGGKAVLLERMPENPGEILLTDDGREANADTNAKIVAGEGNDVLTLNANIAKDIGLSRGTADTLDDLLFEMGLSRSSTVVKGRSAQIMRDWREGVDRAIRDVRRYFEELQEVPGGSTYDERTKARGRVTRILGDIQRTLARYGEAFGKSQVDSYNARLTDLTNSIKNEQQRDAMAERKRK